MLVVILCMLAVGTMYLGAANIDITGPGESRVAEIAREMYERGNFLLPSMRGEVTEESLTKPPLFHWLVVATASPMQWENFSIRIPSMLAMMLSLLLVYRLGARVQDEQTGALAAVVLASSGLYLDYGVSGRIDVFFSMLILAAMLGLVAAVRREDRAVPLAVFFGATGLAVVTKGPAGFLIPIGTAVVYALFNGRKATLKALFPWWGVLLMLAIALPWYLYVIVAAPPEVVNNMFFGEFTNWVEGESTPGGQSTPGYYLPFLFAGLFPWSGFLPVALWHSVTRIRREQQRTLLLVIIWFLGGLLLFSLGGKKAGRYLLPIIPAAAIVLGWYWRQLLSAFSRYRTGALVSAAFVMLAVLLLTGALLFALVDPDSTLEAASRKLSRADRVPFRLIWELVTGHVILARVYVASIAGLSILALVALWRGRVSLAAGSYGVLVLLLASIYFHVITPYRVSSDSFRPMAMEARLLVGDDSRLVGGGSAYHHAFLWYLGHHFEYRSQRDLEKTVLSDPATAVVIMHRKPLPEAVLSARPHREWQIPSAIVTLFPDENTLQQAVPAVPENR